MKLITIFCSSFILYASTVAAFDASVFKEVNFMGLMQVPKCLNQKNMDEDYMPKLGSCVLGKIDLMKDGKLNEDKIFNIVKGIAGADLAELGKSIFHEMINECNQAGNEETNNTDRGSKVIKCIFKQMIDLFTSN